MCRVLLCLSLVACLAREDTRAPDFKELGASVTVLRDGSGTPHIYGASDGDVAFVTGYEHARDRLFQMDLLRRTAQGRMAEIFGERWQETNYFVQDLLLRAVGFYRSAEETATWLRRNDRRTFTMLSAYSAGVSTYIADAKAGTDGASLPYGFGSTELGYQPEPWTPADSLSIAKLQTWALSSSVPYELLSTLIQYVLSPEELADLVTYRPSEEVFILDGFPAPGGSLPRSAPSRRRGQRRRLSAAEIRQAADRVRAAIRALTPLGIDAGSNNWVVSGSVTANGRPILCNDPHLPLSSQSVFYMLHLNTVDRGGDVDVAGVSFPGAPVVVIGHNQRIAWGATVARGDVADIFAEKLSADRRSTIHDDGEEPLFSWVETFRIRRPGAPMSDFEERERTLQAVPRHGPVLPSDATIPPALAGADLLSMTWTGLGVTNEVGAFVRLNRATDVAGFRGAMDHMSVGAQNFVYADGDGHIAYSAHSRYPIRRNLSAQTPPWFVLPGGGAFDWTGTYVPDDRIPQALDPARGFIATANNDPVGLTADGDPLNDLYYLGPLYDTGYRAWRITTELERLVQRARAGSAAGITVAEMKSLQTDTYLRIADRFLPHLFRAWDAAATDPALAQFAADVRIEDAVNRLAAWDRRAAAASPGAALFHLWLGYLGIGALRDDISGTIFDSAAEASLDVLIRPLLRLLEQEPPGPGVRDYFDRTDTPAREGRDEIILNALRQAVDHGRFTFGTGDASQWRWADMHSVTFHNEFGGSLEVGPVGIEGGIGSINVAEPVLISPEAEGRLPDRFDVIHGVSLRMVVTFDDTGRPRAEVILPGGQSERPGHPHFADQVQDWAAGRYRPLPFARADVEAAAQDTKTYPAGFPTTRN